jgi:hypothetical protein
MKVRALVMILATSLVLAAGISVAKSAEVQRCPANVLAPLNTGFANPRTAPNPFEGDWCGFWDGSPSAIRIHRIGARTANVVTTYVSSGKVYVSHDRAIIRAMTLSYTTPGRGKLRYTLAGQILDATLQNDSGKFATTFNRVK